MVEEPTGWLNPPKTKADLERQIAELRAKCDAQLAETQRAWNERDGEKRKRLAAEAESTRLKALPLKDEVERVMERASATVKRYRRAGLGDDVFHSNLCETDAAIDDLLSRLRAGVQEGWRTMDSAPGDEETPVLLWINGQCAVGLTWKRSDGTIIGKASMFGNSIAEYWQPLPASPSVSEGGDRG